MSKITEIKLVGQPMLFAVTQGSCINITSVARKDAHKDIEFRMFMKV